MYYIKAQSVVIACPCFEAYPQFVYVTETEVPTFIRKKPSLDPETGKVCIVTCGMYIFVDESDLVIRKELDRGN